MKTLQRKISNATQIINTLSYTCTDAKHLQTMLDKLDEQIREFKAGLPSSEGLTLRPLSLLKRTRQIRRILHTLQEAESQKHQNITAQPLNRDTGKKGAHVCTIIL